MCAPRPSGQATIAGDDQRSWELFYFDRDVKTGHWGSGLVVRHLL